MKAALEKGINLLRNENRTGVYPLINENKSGDTLISENSDIFAKVVVDTPPAFRSGKHPHLGVKKIPPELRRRKLNFASEPVLWKRLVWRLKEDSQFLRSTIQFTFALLCVWIGADFYLFVRWGESQGLASFHAHPPGAEGFLPISALMGLKLWLVTGAINEVHPAGLLICSAVVLLSIVARKAFCSWLCPIGTLSESLWMLGQKLFGRNFQIWKWLDYPLRSLKYLLLFFFAYSIWQMDSAALDIFIRSPYNKVADIKMYYFFAHIGEFAIWTIIGLMFLSMLVKNFWCRFLCPYGALLGLAGLLSPLKVRRNAATCVDCELCTKVCPSGIHVHKVQTVWSDECMNCLACVAACPVIDTLDVRAPLVNTRIPSWVLGTLIAGIFVAVTGLGMITGHWQNKISREEYLKRFENIDSPLYEHNGGEVPSYSPND